MKLLYIKNGNVCAQLKRLGAKPVAPPEGGPDAFLGDLLKNNDTTKLMISWDIVDDELTIDNVRAITYKVGGNEVGALKKILLRMHASINGAYQILTFAPDKIVCGRVGLMLWLTYILSRLVRKPYIHSRHNSLEKEADTVMAAVAFWLDKYCIRRAAGVICHGPFLVEQVVKTGVDRSKVFDFDVGYKNFVADLTADYPSNRHNAVSDVKNKVLLYVGRMAKNKGIYDLLEAAQMTRENGLNVSVVYIGDGPEVQAFRDYVNKHDLSGFVDIKGRVEHDQLPVYISQSHLMVTPTRSEFPEGRCMSAMEGLACGIPLLAPDNGPFPYLVDNGVNGMLYEVDNTGDMAEKITSIISDDAEYDVFVKGAKESSRKLEKPDLTFNQAVEKAFSAI